MTNVKTISVSEEFAHLAKENNISWSEAARVGMSILLSDAGLREYDNNINVIRKTTMIRESMQKKIDELNEEIEKINDNTKSKD